MSFGEPKMPTAEEIQMAGEKSVEEDEKNPVSNITSKEDWDAYVVGVKKEGEDWNADREATKNADVEKWMRRARAMEVLVPTGNLQEDGEKFFAALNMNPNHIQRPYDLAFRYGDDNLMREFFGNIRKALDAGPPGNEGVQAWHRAEAQFIDEVLRLNEQKLER